MLKTQEFIKQYGLKKLIEKYQLRANYHKYYKNLVQLCYHQLNTPKNEITNECRGLILDINDDFKVIAHPFNRFSDYDYKVEKNNKIDLNSVTDIFEKLDGSIITMYYYDNKWNVSTKGLPDASGEVLDIGNKTYNDYFWEIFNNLGYKLPDVEDSVCNFIFEFRIPTDRFLVKCNEADIILIAIRNIENDEELHIRFATDTIGKKYNWRINPSLDITIEEAFDNVKKCNPLEMEGYVFVDKYFNRVKVKSPQYDAINLLRLNTYQDQEEWLKRQEQIAKNNFRQLCDIVRVNLHDNFIKQEKYKALEEDYYKIRKAYLQLKDELETLVEQTKHLEGKELGLVMKKHQEYNGLVFGIKQNRIKDVYEYLYNMNIKDFERIIKKSI